MKVYIALFNAPDDSRIIGVYSSKKEAEEVSATFRVDGRHPIDAFEVDGGIRYPGPGMKLYFIRNDGKMSVKPHRCNDDDYFGNTWFDPHLKVGEVATICRNQDDQDLKGYIEVQLWASSYDEALTVAEEKFKEYAEKNWKT